MRGRPLGNVLTRKQTAILEFIVSTTKTSGVPPTRHEIAQHFGFASDNSAQDHLLALQQHGAITLIPRAARGIRIVPPAEPAHCPHCKGVL